MSTITIDYRNSQEAFIGKHIAQALENDGHEASDIRRAVQRGIDHYRSSAGFARAKQMLFPTKSKRQTKSKAK